MLAALSDELPDLWVRSERSTAAQGLAVALWNTIVSRPNSLPSKHGEGAHTCSLTPQTSIPLGIEKTADLCGPTGEGGAPEICGPCVLLALRGEQDLLTPKAQRWARLVSEKGPAFCVSSLKLPPASI